MSERKETQVRNMEIGRKYYLKKGDESKILLEKKFIHHRDQGSLEPSYELTFEGVGKTITTNWDSRYDMDATYKLPKEGDIFIKNIDGRKYEITKITDNDEGRLYTLKNNDDWFATDFPYIDFYKNFTSQEQIFNTNFANNHPELIEKNDNTTGFARYLGGKRKSRKQKKSLKRKPRKQKKSLKKRR
jgi:hypothetical protein